MALGQHRDQRAIAACAGARTSDEIIDLGARRADMHRRSISPVGRSPARRTRRRPRSVPTRRASPTPRPTAAASCPIPRSAAAGCPCRTAGEAVFGQRRLAAKSPRNMPPICGMVTWLSSANTSALSGRIRTASAAARPACGREIARIVLDAGAASGRLHHFDVEGVRCSSRCASSKRPCACNWSSRCFNSALIDLIA